MTDRSVIFDFAATFSNGGGIQGQDFRLGIDDTEITDGALARHIVADLNLLMVSHVEIINKRYITESHKRSTLAPSRSGELIDISHWISDGMVTYPGLPAPALRTHLGREESRGIYADGTEFHIGGIDMVGNTGTYIDTPYHRYAGGHDIAHLPLDRIVGVPGVVVVTADRAIGPETFVDVDTWGQAVLIHTGWDSHFGQADYLGEHPHLTEAAALRLAEGGAAVVGIDSSNIDDTGGDTRPAHSILLDQGIPIIEHLARLDDLGQEPFELFAIPPPIEAIGSFPIRAVARLRSLPSTLCPQATSTSVYEKSSPTNRSSCPIRRARA